MLANVVIVDRLLDEQSDADECVYRIGCSIGGPEERLAVELAGDLPGDFDDRVWSDDLQVEDASAGFDSGSSAST